LETPLIIDILKKRPEEVGQSLTSNEADESDTTLDDTAATSSSSTVANSNNTATDTGRELLGSLILEPQSLWLWCDDVYEQHLHSIAHRQVDIIHDKVVNLTRCDVARGYQVGHQIERGRRISLTIRVVQKVMKANILGGLRR
jgi:hypothetical protein